MSLKEKLKRSAVLMLSVMMALTCMPMNAPAEEVGMSSDLTTTEVIVIPVEDEGTEEVSAPPSAEEQKSETSESPQEDEISAGTELPPLTEESSGTEESSASMPSEEHLSELPQEDASDVESELPSSSEQPTETEEVFEDGAILPDSTSEQETEEQTSAEENELPDDRHPLQVALEAHHCIYVHTVRKTKVYDDAALKGTLVYTTTSDIFLMLATDFTRYETVKVWFMDKEYQVVSGYVDADNLDTAYLLPDEATSINDFFACEGMTSVGWMSLFIVNGSYPEIEDTPVSEPVDGNSTDDEESNEATDTDEQAMIEEPQENIPTGEEHSEEELSDDVPADEPSDNLLNEEPIEEPAEEMTDDSRQDDAEIIEEVPLDDETPSPEVYSDDSNLAEDSELPSEDDIMEEIETPSDVLPDENESQEDAETSAADDSEPIVYANPNDYIGVTTATRVLSEADEIAVDDYYCDTYLGNFVKQATVQVLSVETDAAENIWYQVRYLYGDTFKNGTLKWTDYATAWVLASETCEPFDEKCTVTDFAYTEELLQMSNGVSFYASAMDGFTLKNISGSIGSFYAGQSNLYGSSGKDSAYPQIAKSADHGTIYATPHYLEGYTVYCLEHTLSGPGEGSGSNKTATGPYALTALDSDNTSSLPFKASTMHALAWVLRHSYPFMALKRSDSNNEVWSRVAGQFAIREVIKQLEGSQYVRDYWDMDSFYSFTGGAPAVYLTYAKWLASNGIARSRISGNITVSNQSVKKSGDSYIGTATLSTDADLVRIEKTIGTVSGNSGGEDTTYYYAQSGDTIQVASAESSFTVPMESVSSSSEEANFLVGIPSANIQKVLVPISGDPYPLQSASVTFTAPKVSGMIQIIKTDSITGKPLTGVEFTVTELDTNEKVAVLTTNESGIAQTEALPAGQYKVTETGVPDDYIDAGFETTVTIDE